MSSEARFFPGVCPGCGEPVRAAYSQYARARPHPLFVPLLVADFVLAVVLVLVAFWAVAQVTDALLGGQGLKRKERGIAYFAALAVTASLVIWGAVRLARLLERLPRTFEYECATCRWVVPTQVVVGALPADAGLTARVVEVDTDGPLATMRERRERRDRDRAKYEELEQPPNPDFDFGPREKPL